MALHHAAPGEVIDLNALTDRFPESKSVALAKTATFEAVRLLVAKGKTLPMHHVPGAITLLCLEGRALLGLEASTVELSAGNWVFLEGGAPHSVEGVEDCVLLLTILFDA